MKPESTEIRRSTKISRVRCSRDAAAHSGASAFGKGKWVLRRAVDAAHTTRITFCDLETSAPIAKSTDRQGPRMYVW